MANITECIAILEAEPEGEQKRRKVIYVNDAFVKRTGYDRKEIIGETLGMLSGPNTDPQILHQIQEAMAGRYPCDFDLRQYKKSGEPFWSHVSYAPVIDEGGGCSHWVAVGSDITVRRKREKTLQELYQKNCLILESAGEGIYGIDTEGRCTFINKAAAAMFGYERRECLGENMHELIHYKHADGDLYPESECPIFVSKNKHESCRITDEVFWRADGTRFEVEYTSKPMIEEGEIKGAVIAFSDITERKDGERKLRQSLKEKETLLMEIHHRVKNNMAVVAGMMQLQAYEESDEKLKDKLLNSVSRIQSMGAIHELLYKSKSFSNLEFSDNVRQLVENIMATFQAPANVDVQYEVLPLKLNINQAIPCSLIINEVVTNALKHAFKKRNDGLIQIGVHEKGGMVNLIVRDNGIGLSPDFKTPKQSGTLGMQIIDMLSQQLEGEYEYKKVDNGVSFNLSFRKSDVKGIGNNKL